MSKAKDLLKKVRAVVLPTPPPGLSAKERAKWRMENYTAAQKAMALSNLIKNLG